MDHKQVREQEARCIQEQPPACTAACPLHVDVRSMIAAIQKGYFAAAFTIFGKTVPFPLIISSICDHPCQRVCKRNEAGEAILINNLEQACVKFKGVIPKKNNRLPKKDKCVAVVGAGLSGLTAAFDLAQKGYQVTIYEESGRLGGRIWEFGAQQLPRGFIETDLAVLYELGVKVNLLASVSNVSLNGKSFDSMLQEYDSIYLGLGLRSVNDLQFNLQLREDGFIRTDAITHATSHEKVFAGGASEHKVAYYSPINSMLAGRSAAISIDRFLQQASLTARREQEGPFTTRLYTDVQGIPSQQVVSMTDEAQGYSPAEAVREAERCLQCQCLECVKVCEYLAHYGAYPKRYVREIYNNDSIVMGIHYSNRMVNSCALCGLCLEVCPVNFNMGEVCRAARESMVQKGKMPPSAHDFALRDMQFSNSDAFFLARHQPGLAASDFLFFPGCQLSASSPDYVEKIYAYLREKIDRVGIILGCCGAPADWAGQQDVFKQTVQRLATEWNRMGKPRIITACSTCYRMFQDNLPDVPVESLWTLLDAIGLPEPHSREKPAMVCIHDPCTTRYSKDIQDSIRSILKKNGIQVEELDLSRNMTTCCGYGGLMSFANSEVADQVIKRRIGENTNDYLTYCAMCRDNFAAKGKRVLHILDLFYGAEQTDPAARKTPSYSQRHENRARLKAKLLQEVWGEKVFDKDNAIRLIIPEQVSTLMEERMILVEDIQNTIKFAEKTGNKIQDKDTGRLIAHYRPVGVTYWVEYSLQDVGFYIHNVYSHRMEVIEEVGR